MPEPAEEFGKFPGRKRQHRSAVDSHPALPLFSFVLYSNAKFITEEFFMEKIDRQMYDFRVLRALRKRERLSIADVSGRSGVSAAVISKLERNQTLPGLDTLYRISRVFEMHPSDLLGLAETRSARRRQSRTRMNNGIEFQDLQYGNVRCLKGHAKAGAKLSRPEIHGDDYEVCWVQEGHLSFALPNETHELKSGDAIQFDAILAHSYEAREETFFLILRLRKEKRF